MTNRDRIARFLHGRIDAKYLILAVAIAVLATTSAISIINIRAQYQVAAGEYKSSLWYASQLEFELSKFLNALDRVGSVRDVISHDQFLSRFEELRTRVPPLLQSLERANDAPNHAYPRRVQLERMLADLERRIREMRPGDLRAPIEMRMRIEPELAYLQSFMGVRETGDRETFAARESDLQPVYVEMLMTALGAALGIGALIFLLTREIRRTRRAEEEMRLARDEARQANEAKSRFLALMSHEIRTPMTGVLGTLDLLASMPLNRQQRGIADIALRSSKALLDVIDDVLDYSKLEAGRLSLSPEIFDPVQVLKDVVELMAQRAHGDGIELFPHYTFDVPTRLVGDPTRLRQVLLNLVGNGVKFTETGGVTVSMWTVPGGLDETEIVCEVTDTGIGIPESRQAALFSEYAQADAGTYQRYGGTGLGLSIAKRLVEMMGGEISLRSREGEGSTFRFTVRLRNTGVRESARELPVPEFDVGRAVVISDNPVTRAMLANACTLRDWSVEEIVSTDEAVSALSSGGLSDTVVVIDANLSRDGAVELARLFQTGGGLARPAALVIALSRLRAGEVAKWFGFGFDHLALTPFGCDQVFEKIESDAARVVATVGDEADWKSEGLAEAPRVRDGRRVLLVEDVEVNRVVVGTMLRNAGFRVDAVESGREALRAVANGEYAILLVDLHLPDMHGTDVIRSVRSRSDTRSDVPILALSADVVSEDQHRCLEAGANDLVSKPFVQETLAAAIHRLIGRPETPAVKASASGDVPAKRRARQAPAAEPLGKDAAPDADLPLIDMTALNQLEADVGTEIVMTLVEKFLEDIRRRLDRALSLDPRTVDAVEHEVHSIGSSAATFGARRLEAEARDLERDCRTGRDIPDDEIASRLGRLDQLMEESRTAYLDVVGTSDDAGPARRIGQG